MLIFSILLLSACGGWQEKSEVPPTIDKATMINMMVDLAMSDAMVETEMLETNKLIYQKKLTFYSNVLDNYGYSEEDYTSSYEIYAEDLPQLSEMYDSVLMKISKKEIELNLTNNE